MKFNLKKLNFNCLLSELTFFLKNKNDSELLASETQACKFDHFNGFLETIIESKKYK